MSRSIDRVRNRAAIRRVEEVYGADIEDILGALKTAIPKKRKPVGAKNLMKQVGQYANKAFNDAKVAWQASSAGVPQETFLLAVQALGDSINTTVMKAQELYKMAPDKTSASIAEYAEQAAALFAMWVGSTSAASSATQVRGNVDDSDESRWMNALMQSLQSIMQAAKPDFYYADGSTSTAARARSSNRPSPVARSGGGIVSAIKRFFR